jgi:hypothetical protein
MALTTLENLRQAVFDEVIRSTTLAGAFPRLVAFAEHRMFYGAGFPQPSPPLRLGIMETSVQLSVSDGIGALPDDFLEARLILWDNQPNSTPNYEPPTIFRRYRSPLTTGSPLKYTIENGAILFSPRITTAYNANSLNMFMPGMLFAANDDGAATGLTFVYYAKPRPLVEDDDTNPVLLAYPAIYFNAVLGEVYRYLRDNDRRDEAFAVYTGLVNGLVENDAKAVTGGTPLYPRIRNSQVRTWTW